MCLAFSLQMFVPPSVGDDRSSVPESAPGGLMFNRVSHQGGHCRASNCWSALSDHTVTLPDIPYSKKSRSMRKNFENKGRKH